MTLRYFKIYADDTLKVKINLQMRIEFQFQNFQLKWKSIFKKLHDTTVNILLYVYYVTCLQSQLKIGKHMLRKASNVITSKYKGGKIMALLVNLSARTKIAVVGLSVEQGKILVYFGCQMSYEYDRGCRNKINMFGHV